MPVSPTDHVRVPFSETVDGVRVRVRVIPRASQQGVAGIVSDGDGGAVVKATLTASPVDGKITSGASGRLKTIVISGESQMLLSRLNGWTSKSN